MTLNQMTNLLNDRRDENDAPLHFSGDYAGVFGISNNEAARIAAKASSAAEFVDSWENHDWWTDANN